MMNNKLFKIGIVFLAGTILFLTTFAVTIYAKQPLSDQKGSTTDINGGADSITGEKIDFQGSRPIGDDHGSGKLKNDKIA